MFFSLFKKVIISYNGDCMFHFFMNLSPIYQSLIAGIFTFLITTLGSSLVFFFHKVHSDLMDGMMAMAAGIMMAASFFSLLNPAVEIANELGLCTWLIVLLGFLMGGVLLFIGELFFDFFSTKTAFTCSRFRRSIMLFSSITLHNIPEGLVLGVAFGTVCYSQDAVAATLSAIILTVGIALQNFPEGSAISLPLKRDSVSSIKAFLFGSFSAIVEPLFAVIGVVLVLKIQMLLPFIMSFAAGAMIFVVLKELIPEIMHNKKENTMSLLIMIGFSIMMILEIVLD